MLIRSIPSNRLNRLARKAQLFALTAEKLHEDRDNINDSEEVAYYLISHAIELSIKSIAKRETGNYPRIHDKIELAERFKNLCNFTQDEILTIQIIKDLNNGVGGLRYDNPPIGEFRPEYFNNAIKVIERLLNTFIDDEENHSE